MGRQTTKGRGTSLPLKRQKKMKEEFSKPSHERGGKGKKKKEAASRSSRLEMTGGIRVSNRREKNPHPRKREGEQESLYALGKRTRKEPPLLPQGRGKTSYRKEKEKEEKGGASPETHEQEKKSSFARKKEGWRSEGGKGGRGSL